MGAAMGRARKLRLRPTLVPSRVRSPATQCGRAAPGQAPPPMRLIKTDTYLPRRRDPCRRNPMPRALVLPVVLINVEADMPTDIPPLTAADGTMGRARGNDAAR